MYRIGIVAVLVFALAPCTRAQNGSVVAEADPDAAVEAALPRLQSIRAPQRTLISSTSSISKLVSLNYRLGDRQSVGISTEFVKVASFYFKYRGFQEEPDWKFKAVPITLRYERLLADPGRRFVPVAGVGVSYYLTQLRTRVDEAEASTERLAMDSDVTGALGMGWGAQATCGLRARIAGSTFLELQGRYRIIDGLDIMGHGSDRARFGFLDFVVGIGFEI
ncbi:MAG: hypothetical protein KJO98_06345 [Rhodothermia bacterium]|nr:hypothetical protein [Rhodothermia bacterium]